MKMQCAISEVESEFLNIIRMNLRFQMVNRIIQTVNGLRHTTISIYL
jgi:hypothetical protein